MIEIYIAKRDNCWDLNATILPQGGVGSLARDAKLVTLSVPDFKEASEAIVSLENATFAENPERWPVAEPKFSIINLMSHEDYENFGNYKIERQGQVIGTINNFPRSNKVALIREALKIVSDAEKTLAPPVS